MTKPLISLFFSLVVSLFALTALAAGQVAPPQPPDEVPVPVMPLEPDVPPPPAPPAAAPPIAPPSPVKAPPAATPRHSRTPAKDTLTPGTAPAAPAAPAPTVPAVPAAIKAPEQQPAVSAPPSPVTPVAPPGPPQPAAQKEPLTQPPSPASPAPAEQTQPAIQPPAPKPVQQEKPAAPVSVQKTDDAIIQQQSKMANEIFGRILDLMAEHDRKAVLQQIEKLYLEIVMNYPRATVVHEAYWRLLQIYVNDFSPPAFAKAEDLNALYRRSYPEQKDQNPVSDALADGYYRNGEWKKLLKFCTPVVKEYIQTGVLSRALDLYLYSEAKYRLGDLVEAEKGYRTVLVKFPKSAQAAESKKRLDEIRAQKEKKQ